MMADIDRSRAESFSSVYVLDSHYQYKDVGVVNIFNSPAGRELVATNQSPERRKCNSNNKISCSSKRSNHDITKFVLNPENLLINDMRSCMDFQINYPNYNLVTNNIEVNNLNPLETNLQHGDIQNGDDFNSIHLMNEAEGTTKANNLDLNMESNECNGGITRRLVNQHEDDYLTHNKRPQLDKSQSLADDEYNGVDKQHNGCEDAEMRIDRRILRCNSTRDIIKQNNFSGEKCDIFRKLLSGFLSGWSTGSLSDITRWRKRKSSDELYREASLALGIPCELTDSCRCLECQCHYFDCGDSDSESSEVSINLYDSDIEEWSQEQTSTNHYSDVVFYENETSHNSIDSQASVDKEYTSIEMIDIPDDIMKQEKNVEASGEWSGVKTNSDAPVHVNGIINNATAPALEIAAGTPVILDHLLNNPMSCTLQ